MSELAEYPKINTIWKRDERGVISVGEYATEELAYLADCQWEWTEKLDGTNVRIGWDGHAVEYGGRTANAQMPTKLVAALREMFTEERLAGIFGEDAAVLYGEGVGAGIQSGGGNYSPTQTFVLFDVTVGTWWLRRPDVADIAHKLILQTAPAIFTGTLLEADAMTRKGITSRWGNFPAEGLVGRPIVELFNRKGERVMAKIKTKDFARLKVAA